MLGILKHFPPCCVIFLAVALESAMGSDLAAATAPKISAPGYLESYVDPVFKTTVTRITGIPGSGIPNLNGQWAAIARHHYSKDAAWNCDQSLLFLASGPSRRAFSRWHDLSAVVRPPGARHGNTLASEKTGNHGLCEG